VGGLWDPLAAEGVCVRKGVGAGGRGWVREGGREGEAFGIYNFGKPKKDSFVMLPIQHSVGRIMSLQLWTSPDANT